MRFKQFLREAEWVGGKRYPSVEALWHIISPLAGSNQHLIALGESQAWAPPRRDEPLAGPNENIPATGVRSFMNYGLENFPEEFDDKDQVLIKIIQVKPQYIWTIDPKVNEKNPWLIMQTHWRDLQEEFNRIYKKYTQQALGPGYFEAKSKWQDIAQKVDLIYRRGYSDSSMMDSLRHLFFLIYVDAPRLLNYAKKGYMFQPKGWERQFRHWEPTFSAAPQALDMYFPKALRWDFKILTKTLPLTDTQWAIINDRRAIASENSVIIPGSFKGFRRAGEEGDWSVPTGQPSDYGRTFFAPNVRAAAGERRLEELARYFEEMATDLEHFLEYLDEALESGRWIGVESRARNITMGIEQAARLLKRVQHIVPDFTLPDEFAEIFQQFHTHAQHIFQQNEIDPNGEYGDDYDTWSKRYDVREMAGKIYKGLLQTIRKELGWSADSPLDI